jgi:hypothetical protein
MERRQRLIGIGDEDTLGELQLQTVPPLPEGGART